jgi:protein TonB
MTSPSNPGAPGRPTANERFKRRFGQTFWTGMIAAAALHFLAFAFFPDFTVAIEVNPPVELTVIDPLPEFDVPPPPAEIPRPAMPVASDTDVSIIPPETTFDANPPLPPSLPAPATRSDEKRDERVFVPFTVAPRLLNRAETERALQRSYPPFLRDAGVGGRPTVWIHVDENGEVIGAQIHESSNREALDQAALAVAHAMKFSPALNFDRKVSVWVSIPISFSAKAPVPESTTL